MKYTLENSAPSYIFHNQHKTLNNLYIFRNQHKTLDNLFSPDPAVSFADTQASHHEINIMSYFVAFHLGVCHFFSTGCVQMGLMDIISCNSFRLFCKNIWEIFHLSNVTGVYADQLSLFVHSTLIRKQRGLTQISLYIHVPFDHDVFIKLHFGASSVISDRPSM